MPATVDQVIDSAMRMNKLLSPGQVYANSSSATRLACIEILNYMLEGWQADGINVPAHVRNSPFTLTAGTANYTVGPGGAISIARPTIILKVTTIPVASSPITELPCAQLTQDEYDNWPNKETNGQPVGWFYNNSMTSLGTISFVWPPDSAWRVVLYTLAQFTTYASGGDLMYLPSGYDDAIRSNLAMRLRSELSNMGASMDPQVFELVSTQARNSKATIQRLNFRLPQYFSDFPGPNQPLTPAEFSSGAFLYNW
jgi:hypothetical protein